MWPNIVYQRNWTQDDLVGKLQLVGCYMTRDILASIEHNAARRRTSRLSFFAHVLGVKEGDLFPIKRHFSGQTVGLNMESRPASLYQNAGLAPEGRLLQPAKK